MLVISIQQLAEFKRHRRQAFINAQLTRLRALDPEAFTQSFREDAAAIAFVEQLLAEAGAAGINDCANLETLLDTCLTADWISPMKRSKAGVDAILADPALSDIEKVTRFVNAAAFATAFGRGRL